MKAASAWHASAGPSAGRSAGRAAGWRAGRAAAWCWRLALALLLLALLRPEPVLAQPQFCPAQAALPAGTPVLKVGVKYAPPFVMSAERGRWRGLGIEAWETVALCLGARHAYSEFATTEEMIAALEQHQIDVAVGAISITSARALRVDFSQPFHQGALGVLVRDVPPERGLLEALAAFFQPTVLGVIVALVLATVLIGWAYWRYERAVGNELFASGPADGFYNAMIWSVQLVFSGRGDPLKVHYRTGQLFVLFLTFFGATIVSSTTAIITSSLTLQGISAPIRHVDDLRKTRVAVMTSGTAGAWAQREKLFVTTLRAWPEVQRQFDEQAIGAFVHDRDILQFLVKDGYLKNVRVEPASFQPDGYGFALASGSALRRAIDASLLAVQEDRVWGVLTAKYLGER